MSNMRQIARLAGVSLTTVSLALRDHPNISLATRERVKEVARKLNYTLPAQRVPDFAGGRVIGYVIHDWFGIIATDILRGAMEEARSYKFGFLMQQVSQSEEWVEEAINNLLDIGVSGLVMAHSLPKLLPRRTSLTLRSRGIHVVQVMNRMFMDPADAVCRSEWEYATAAAAYLASLGHRRLFGLSLPQPDVWMHVMREHGIECTIISASGSVKVGQAFEVFLQMSPRPTAVMGAMDDTAYRFYNLARLAGLSVPGEVSVMGLGNMFEDYLYPEITTIDIQAREMGRAGIRLLAERIEAGIPPHEITDFHDVVLPAQVIERGSTGPTRK